MQPEARFKRHLLDGFDAALEGTPLFAVPLVASLMQKSGLPDLFFSGWGASAWIEAKRDGNTLRGAQKTVIPKMVASGARVLIAHVAMELPVERRVVSIRPVRLHEDRPLFWSFSWKDVCLPRFWEHVLKAPFNV